MTIKIITNKVLNSESIVIIRIKGGHLLYSKISGGLIGYGWMHFCYIVMFPQGNIYYIVKHPRKGLLYSKYSEGECNIPGEGLLCGRFTIRHRHYSVNTAYLFMFNNYVIF